MGWSLRFFSVIRGINRIKLISNVVQEVNQLLDLRAVKVLIINVIISKYFDEFNLIKREIFILSMGYEPNSLV